MTKDQLIVHTKYGACVWGETRNECSFAEEQYACGYSPPNYPVPAILVDVTIWREVVIIDEWFGWPNNPPQERATFYYKGADKPCVYGPK